MGDYDIVNLKSFLTNVLLYAIFFIVENVSHMSDVAQGPLVYM